MFNEEFHLEQPIRWGMVGGGRGSQIGYIRSQFCIAGSPVHAVRGCVRCERGARPGIRRQLGRCPRALLPRLQDHVCRGS